MGRQTCVRYVRQQCMAATAVDDDAAADDEDDEDEDDEDDGDASDADTKMVFSHAANPTP